MLSCFGVGGGFVLCIPPIRGDFWWWKYILFWGHTWAGGPHGLNFWYSSLDVWAWFWKPSLFPSAVPGHPLFVILIFGGFPGVFYFGGSREAFYLLSSFRPHFLVDLVHSFFYFFGIFCFFFMFGSAWLCILRFLFRKTGGRGVFLEGVQKYFEKMEMMWSHFQKARDARADLTVRARWKIQKKYQKNAKNRKNPIFRTKKSPLKSVKRHLDGRFSTTPCRMSSFWEPPHFDFCFKEGSDRRLFFC